MSDAIQQTSPLPVHPEQWVLAVQKAWRAKGFRLTEPRNQVLRLVVSYYAPFSAEQLYADLQQAREEAPGRATVYRTLEQLSSDGWLARIHSNTGEVGYYTSFPGHIHHLVCTSCGRVVVFEGCVVGDMLATLAQQTRFTIQGHSLEVYGLCDRCRGELHSPQ